MTTQDDQDRGTDDRTSAGGGLPLDRRTALKGGAAGLTALALGGLGTTTVAAQHEPANKTSAAGSTVEIFSSPEGTQGSEVATMLEIPNVKASGSEQDTLVFQPTVESSLFTRVGSDGKDNGKEKDRDGTSGWDSVASAGLLAWIEIAGDATGGPGDWRTVDLEGNVTDRPPLETPSDLVDANGNLAGVADSVAALNSREFKLEWDVQDLIDAVHELQGAVDGVEYTEFDLLLDLYVRTRSSNGFSWIARGVNGVNDLRLRGALYDFTYSDDTSGGTTEARAVVGNRSMVVHSMKLPHDVY